LLLWCQSSLVSVTARLERRSDSSGRCELRRTPLRFVRLLCCSPAPHGAFLASRLRSPGGALESRESFTQDSRSAVRARLYFRSVTRIIRRGALHASRQKTWRPRKRPSRGFEPFVMRRKPVDSRADRGMRAYVTSGCTANDDARRQHRACALRTRPVPLASSWLVADKRSEGHSRHAPHVGGDLGGMLRGTAGDACASLQASRPTVATRGSGVRRWSASQLTRTRDCEIAAAHGHRRFRYPEVAPGVPIRRQAQDPYAASDATSVHDRGNMPTLLVSRRARRSRYAWIPGPPRGMSSDRPSRGRHTSLYGLKDSETSLRPPWGRP